jgi:hypothetical protein
MGVWSKAMITTTPKGLTIVAAMLAGGTSAATAQSILPWEYVVAPGVFMTRPGYGVPRRGMLWHGRILRPPDAIHRGTSGATAAPQELAGTKWLTP